jgi:thiamine-monophosphate kinase
MTPGPAVLSLTMIGAAAAGTEVRRRGARPGDMIWVSGTIGDAFLGLEVLRGRHPALAAKHRTALVARYRLPEPRTELGPQLAGIATAMIDVSDGLLADLGHICEVSNAAAVVELTALPLSPAAEAAVAAEPALRPLLAAGGDDYELLFTAPENAASAIAGLAARLGLPLAPIGRIEPGAGVRLVAADGRAIAVAAAGWRHF